jgi:hypothetical protein
MIICIMGLLVMIFTIFFLYISCGRISPKRSGKLVTTYKAPRECCTAVTTSLPCSLRHGASQLGFGGLEPFTPRVGFYVDVFDCSSEKCYGFYFWLFINL